MAKSFSHCIKTLVNSGELSQAMADDLAARAATYARGGYSAKDAHEMAVSDALQEQRDDLAAVYAQIGIDPSEDALLNSGATEAKKSNAETDATLARTKERSEVRFTTPYVGPTGVKLTGYVWPNKKEEYIDNRGEERVRTVSDWEAAVTNLETGRQIVHQFFVEKTDGTEHQVSAESAAVLLGIAESTVRSNAKKLLEKQIRAEKKAIAEAEGADELDAHPTADSPASAIEQGTPIDYAPNVVERFRREGPKWNEDPDTAYILGDRKYRFATKNGKYILTPSLIPEDSEMARRGWKTVELKAREIWPAKPGKSTLDFTAQDVAKFGAAELARHAAWFEKYGADEYKTDPAFAALLNALRDEFGTDSLADFAGAKVRGVSATDASVAYARSKKDTSPAPVAKTSESEQVAQSEFSDIEKSLAAKAHETEQDGDIGVVVGGGKVRFVAMAAAADAARQALANGVRPQPFQIHNATGIRLGDVDRVLQYATAATEETPPSELVAAGATTDNHVARAIKATKDFLDKFNDSPRELKEQRKFTAAAESKFGIDKIAGYRGGFTVHVNDRSDGNATVYMQSPTGDFVTSSTIPLSDTAVYRTDQETPPSEQVAGADQDSLTSDQETLTGPYTLAEHVKLMDAMRSGTLSLADYQAAFQRAKDGQEALRAEFAAMTKDKIMKTAGIGAHYRNEAKDRLVRMAVDEVLDDFDPREAKTWTMGTDRHGYISKVTQEDLDAYADRRRQRLEALMAERLATMEGIDNPQTLDDYQNYIRAKKLDGMTFADARMTLTPEQRATYDELLATQTRDARQDRADQQKTAVQVAAKTTEGQIVQTKHTRTGQDLFVVKAAERVERDVYNQWSATARRMGGWYSSFKGNGAVPGFQFKTMQDAEAFLQYLGGDVAAAKEQMQERRDAFDDDKSQSAVDRLREMADAMESAADASLSVERKSNTARRARFAAAAEAGANDAKAMAQTMRNIAQAIEDGSAKFLDRVRTKVQIQMLNSIVGSAQWEYWRKKYPSYAEQEKHKGERPIPEVADYVKFPYYTAYRSDLARLGRELLQSDGTKKLGQRLLSVADDVTDTYLEFAKANFHRVSTFSLSGGGQAWFKNREQAEEAIKRSGLKGKAIVLPVKRGQNAIIQSPTFARENGIWEGDDDKQISLESSFGAELVAKANEYKRPPFSIPYYFHGIAEKQARLKAMGIETPAEFRAMLREFIGMKQAPKAPDRVKELERAMAGKRNTDGLDFFPTPASTAQAMIDAAGLEPDMRVLEPSAGMGHIADMIRDAGVEPDVVEMANDRKEFLEAKGFNVVGRDFMEIKARAGFTYGDLFRAPDGTTGIMQGSGGIGSSRVVLADANGRSLGYYDRDTLEGVEQRKSGYDRIIMNPPFSDRRDTEHVRHAYTLLAPGGRIVAIMGEGSFFGQDKKAQEFRDWLESVGGTSEKLEQGTFLDPSLPVNTGVNARMVVIDKPMIGLESRSPLDNGISRASVKQAAEQLLQGLKNPPALEVVWRPSELPFKAPADAKGATQKGVLWIVAGSIRSAEDIREVIFHELTHFGLRGFFGRGLDDALAAIHEANPRIRMMAAEWKRNNPDWIAVLKSEYRLSDSDVHYISIDEAVAKLGQTGATLKGWRRFAAALQTLLRTIGLDRLANSLEAKTDAEALLLLKKAGLFTSKGVTAGTYAKEPAYPQLMIAWHGSPHEHDGFDLSKIGTGEGVQAFGWGHYFAGARAVAEWYRNKLASGYSLRGKKNYEHTHEEINAVFKIARLLSQGANEQMAINLVAAEARRDVDQAKQRLAEDEANSGKLVDTGPGWGDLRYRAVTQADVNESRDGLERAQKRLAVIEGIKPGDVVKNKGRLYQVELAPAEGDYLLWDMPLSEQSARVTNALSASGFDWEANSERETGAHFYKRLADEFGGQREASEILLAQGIRGIKYLDGTSRNRPLKDIKADFLAELPENADTAEVVELLGTGTFSPKNEALIKALADDDWLGFDYPAQAISAALGIELSNYDASPALLEAVSDVKAGGTYNYVIFDDADVKIVGKESRMSGSPVIAAERARYQAVVDKFVKRFKGAAALDIRLVATRSEIPERYRPSPFAEGVYHSGIGTVWLITDNLTPARANQVLLHETIGHYGLASMMGERFSGLLPSVKRVARAKATLVDDTLQPGDADYATWEAVKLRYPEASESELAQEVLARMAETEPDASMLAYVRAVVRKWLREVARALGVDLDVSATELNDLLILAAAHVRRGDNLNIGTIEPEVVASSKSRTVAQTETPEFKRWFGDSKVVDKNGKPLVVHHGTERAGFSSFDRAKQNTSSGTGATGFFFTNHKLGAETYSGTKREAAISNASDFDPRYDGEPGNYSVYLAISNPLEIDFGGNSWDSAPEDSGFGEQSINEIAEYAEAAGYDGVIVRNINDEGRHGQGYGWGDTTYIAFRPEQIKSAIGNNGNFDSSNPSILESRAAQSALPIPPEVVDSALAAARVEQDRINAYNLEEEIKSVVNNGEVDMRPLLNDPMFYDSDAEELTQSGYEELDRLTEEKARDNLNLPALDTLDDLDNAHHWAQYEAMRKLLDGLGIDFVDTSSSQSKYIEVAGHKLRFADHGNMTRNSATRGRLPIINVSPNGATFSDALQIALSEGAPTPDSNELGTKALEQSKMQERPAVRADESGSPEEPAQSGSGAGSKVSVALESRAAQSALPLAGGQSAAQSAWDIDPDTRLTRLIYRFQDKHVDTKALVKAIEESRGQATPDSFDPYLGEELYHKRTAARVDAFADGELKPLLNAMRLAGVGREEFEQYLHARHAQEANQIIRDREGMDDGGSGMLDADAQTYLSGLDPAKRLTYERLARQVDAIIAKTRQTLVDYGLESQDTIDAWARMFQHYVPLNREDMETGTGIGQGFSVRGPASKSRTGSSRQVVDILANIAQQRDRAIVRGEKNRVATALYGLAYLNPNKDVWQAGIVPTKQVVVDGKIATVPDHNYKNEPNVIVARIKDRKGQVHDRAIIFNRHNERAMRLAGAMKNLDAPQMGELMNAAGKITRYLSAINTQYNPVFVFVNLMRDVQSAMFNLASTPLAGMQTEVAGHTASALRGIFSDLRAHRAGQQPSSVWAQLYEEMQREGGTTGYRDMFGTAQERSAEQIDKLLDPDWWAKTKWGKALTAGGILKAPEQWLVSKPGKALFNLLSDANETSENAIRLAVYKTAIDHGMSKARAASLSKNITVNFNRKGQLGSQMNSLYAFFNAAVQGTARLAETLRSPAGKQIMSGGVLLGMVQALALAAAFDDDDPPDFVRERNLIIPLGGKRYFTVPMPLGLHVLPNVGRIPMELVLRGFKKPGKAATDFLSVFAEAFNPIGNAGMSWQTLTPSVIDPAVALLENKDWSGRPIARQSFDKNEPGHLRTKDTASPFSKAAARFINAATGGTEYTAGALSPSPDQLDYLIGQATGGIGREASKAFQTAGAMISGEDLPPYKVPLLGRVFGKAEGKSHEGNRFYANLDEVDRAAKELKGRRLDGSDSGEYAREHPEAFLGSLASRTRLRLTMLRRQKQKALEAGNREAVKTAEEQMTQAMRAFNERYAAVTKETSTAD